eukprot:jgi/Chlat1/5918/Chrsp4S00498
MREVYGDYTPSTAWRPRPFHARAGGRYLWSDAFGVCDYLSLHGATRDEAYVAQADAVVRDVHDVLGKRRDGRGRIDGASEEKPTAGGLRIGKEDDESEPDGDGQYFHYLTKWMFALSRMSTATRDDKYQRWAVELAKAAHHNFVRRERGFQRMYWKVSIDGTRPLVNSEGNLDPYDGLVAYRLLMETNPDPHELDAEISDFQSMVEARYPSFRTSDPLDLGEALWLASWYPGEAWARHVVREGLSSADRLWRLGYFEQPLGHRLMFREMGTTMGIQAVLAAPENAIWSQRVDALHAFWRDKVFERDRDISPLMYAASALMWPGVWKRAE